MTPNRDRLQRELLAATYWEALEADDFETERRLWQLAETDAELVALFEQVHADLLAEQASTGAEFTNALTAAVQQHLTAAVVTPPTTTSVQAVAEEVFRQPPQRLSAASHALLEKMRHDATVLPDERALSKLTAWLEAKFGPAEAALWKAIRSAAMKLDARRTSERDYQMAARQAPKSESHP